MITLFVTGGAGADGTDGPSTDGPSSGGDADDATPLDLPPALESEPAGLPERPALEGG